MAILNNNPLIGSGGQQGYSINNSLRFRSSASAYLNRTFATTGTSNTIKTFSFWVKRGSLGSRQSMFGGYDGSSGNNFQIEWESTDTLQLLFGGAAAYEVTTTQVFRDPSAWYHIVIAFDTTQATASNRYKLYVNGTQVTAFGTANYPPQNSTVQFGLNNGNNRIGTWWNASTAMLDGYMADVYFIDGSAKTPSDFGETDTTTGVWKPKAYTGTYGTNGFYLKFSDIATTSGSNAGLGKDFSGNSNYWTTNNISVTSGTTYDAMTDVPTNTSATVANYAVLNPLDKQANAAVENANLQASTATGDAQWKSVRTSMYTNTGKIYFEATLTTVGSTNWVLGLADESFAVGTSNVYVGSSVSSWGIIGISTAIYGYNNGASTTFATGITQAVNDVFMVAVDYDAGKIWFGRNGTWYTSGNPSSGTNQAYTFTANTRLAPAVSVYNGGASTSVVSFNAGQQPFSYTPPTGFVALNTFNLPTPTILQGNKYMDATLYTGNGANRSITNAGAFKPDAIWIKTRSAGAYNHHLVDSVRGANKNLRPNLTGAEDTTTDQVTAINSNGFSLGVDTAGPADSEVNVNGNTYVAWQWQAGQGTTSSNTSGSITSTVSVNTTAGFSVVTYTGIGGNVVRTFGHGLGVAPKMVIVKDRVLGTTGTDNWVVYHASATAAGFLLLNTTAAYSANANYWGNTTPTSSVVSVGGNASNVSNESGVTYVAYCWAAIAGYSAFGSYTGNGGSDGSFVYVGFKPKYVMIKRTDAAGYSWIVEDTSRDTYNVASARLLPDSSAAESTGTHLIDFLSNGFKLRGTSLETNGSGGTYIYACFASNPFKNSNAA